MVAAAGAIAAVICDTSLDWLTDGEDSDSSSEDAFEANLTDFCTCLKCKSQNINPLYRYCQKCFKVYSQLSTSDLHSSDGFHSDHLFKCIEKDFVFNCIMIY